ncbi:hypothetical protein Sarmat_00200 [Rickettsiales endosymbiont of Paramecium tredecaurelia]|uniref:hypothetical protein n=1 Tax=Candidatus Sarmatiella mevalonica TaxID=2770581 RepID=UPI00192127F0|nr:hypothetical protein [Candidatus Sarmatiella mevalonica]MBL3284360.1 hypothetical protein [Candidatus Sarmatiella mevalonica]
MKSNGLGGGFGGFNSIVRGGQTAFNGINSAVNQHSKDLANDPYYKHMPKDDPAKAAMYAAKNHWMSPDDL